jgi:hypothetical protein
MITISLNELSPKNNFRSSVPMPCVLSPAHAEAGRTTESINKDKEGHGMDRAWEMRGLPFVINKHNVAAAPRPQ